MNFFLEFNDLSFPIKERLIEFATNDYLNKYEKGEFEKENIDNGLDYDDLLSLKVSEHISTITIKIK